MRKEQSPTNLDAGDDSGATELRRRIEEASLPDVARREAKRELGRLTGISPSSPEHGMIRTYLEWMASLPWSKLGGETIDIHRARQVLDEDHFDLEKVDPRILPPLPQPCNLFRSTKEPQGGTGIDIKV